MKKRTKTLCFICAIILLAVLFVPFRITHYEDGGTIRYDALTYSVVKWEKLMGYLDENGEAYIEKHENTCFYLFPNNFQDLDDLWDIRH